jgi:hypothetical protein
MSSSVSDLENQPPLLASAAGSYDSPQRTRQPALPTDHLADVVLGDVEVEDDDVVPFLLFDPHGIGLVDQPPGEILEQLSQCS